MGTIVGRQCRTALFLVAFAACDSEGSSVPPAGATALQRVMVIDEGFDPSLPVLAGKVLASYQVSCPAGSPADETATQGCEGDEAGACDVSLAAMKRDLIHELQTADDGCRLEPGLPATPNPLARVATLRARWNEVIERHGDPASAFTSRELDVLGQALAQLDPSQFHGSATSSVVAYANPGVQLVLVNRPLASAADAVSDVFACPSASELERAVALSGDPEVRAAYVASQLPFAQTQVWDAIRTHGIGVVNESFGSPARAALEAMLEQSACDVPEPLAAYFAAMAALERAAEESHGPPDVLVVQSAGNEGSRVSGPMDLIECRLGDPRRLLIGSYADDRSISSFSNFGACVDAYAPGENVLASVSGNWLLPLSGTSFSAPLTSRAASRLPAPAAFSAPIVRDALMAQRDASGNLPTSVFPGALLYPASPVGSSMQALTSATMRRPPQISRALWHRLLAPLRRSRALAR